MNPVGSTNEGKQAVPALSPGQRKARTVVISTGAAICLAVSGVGYFLGVSPALAHLSEQREQQDELAARRQKAAELRAEIATARARLADTRKSVAKLPLRLEPPTAINRRLNRLAESALVAGVTLHEVQPQPAVVGPHYQTVHIRLSGVGSYPASAAFLHALHRDFPDTAVRAVEATNPTPGRDGNTVSFKLELAWHVTK